MLEVFLWGVESHLSSSEVREGRKKETSFLWLMRRKEIGKDLAKKVFEKLYFSEVVFQTLKSSLNSKIAFL